MPPYGGSDRLADNFNSSHSFAASPYLSLPLPSSFCLLLAIFCHFHLCSAHYFPPAAPVSLVLSPRWLPKPDSHQRVVPLAARSCLHLQRGSKQSVGQSRLESTFLVIFTCAGAWGCCNQRHPHCGYRAQGSASRGSSRALHPFS